MPNNHLTDTEYLKALNYKDEYYLISLCQSLWEFIKNAPIPIYTNIYRLKSRDVVNIKLSVGDKIYIYKVDSDISYFDFIFRFKIFAERFYPQFSFEEEVETELTTDEMMKIATEKKMSLNDVVFLTKMSLKKQEGIIHKVMLSKDEFLFEYNGSKSIRTSLCAENIEDILPVRIFLQTVRNMYYKKEEGSLIRDYIFNNSRETQKLAKKEDENEVVIDYASAMIKNFFKIHYNSQVDYELKRITDLNYKWGKFAIVFKDIISEQDCIDYYRKRKETIYTNKLN